MDACLSAERFHTKLRQSYHRLYTSFPTKEYSLLANTFKSFEVPSAASAEKAFWVRNTKFLNAKQSRSVRRNNAPVDPAISSFNRDPVPSFSGYGSQEGLTGQMSWNSQGPHPPLKSGSRNQAESLDFRMEPAESSLNFAQFGGQTCESRVHLAMKRAYVRVDCLTA